MRPALPLFQTSTLHQSCCATTVVCLCSFGTTGNAAAGLNSLATHSHLLYDHQHPPQSSCCRSQKRLIDSPRLSVSHRSGERCDCIPSATPTAAAWRIPAALPAALSNLPATVFQSVPTPISPALHPLAVTRIQTPQKVKRQRGDDSIPPLSLVVSRHSRTCRIGSTVIVSVGCSFRLSDVWDCEKRLGKSERAVCWRWEYRLADR